MARPFGFACAVVLAAAGEPVQAIVLDYTGLGGFSAFQVFDECGVRLIGSGDLLFLATPTGGVAVQDLVQNTIEAGESVTVEFQPQGIAATDVFYELEGLVNGSGPEPGEAELLVFEEGGGSEVFAVSGVGLRPVSGLVGNHPIRSLQLTATSNDSFRLRAVHYRLPESTEVELAPSAFLATPHFDASIEECGMTITGSLDVTMAASGFGILSGSDQPNREINPGESLTVSFDEPTTSAHFSFSAGAGEPGGDFPFVLEGFDADGHSLGEQPVLILSSAFFDDVFVSDYFGGAFLSGFTFSVPVEVTATYAIGAIGYAAPEPDACTVAAAALAALAAVRSGPARQRARRSST